jgi:hypothetical protein
LARPRITVAIALVVASSVLTRGARADEDSPWDRPFAIGGDVPLPMNILGAIELTVEAAPTRWLSFELGGGYAFFRPVASGMVRLQLPISWFAFGVEGGGNVGTLTWNPNDQTDGFASLGGTDVGYGYNFAIYRAIFVREGGFIASRVRHGHFQLRLHGGATQIANRGDALCVGDSGGFRHCKISAGSLPLTMPYFGIGVAYSFDPSR